MSLLHEGLGIRNVRSVIICKHFIWAPLVHTRNYLLAVHEPTLDDVVLRAGSHTCPHEYLLRGEPCLLHAVEAAEAHVNHTAMLFQGEVAAIHDDGIR